MNCRLESRAMFMAVALCLTLSHNAAWSWWGDSHATLTRASMLALPESMPVFFREGVEVVSHCAYDADLAKNRTVPHLSHAEHPEHFLDIELLQGSVLPEKRYDYIALCQRLSVSPAKAGFLTYAVAEWTQQLAVAFAEHRQWPEVAAIHQKCLVYAGTLAHYAQDMCQPLHLTIHYDGRVTEAGTSPHSGIHEKVDSLVERLQLRPQDLAAGLQPVSFDSLMSAVMSEFHRGHRRLDALYDLEDQLGSVDSDEAREFAVERARAAAGFTASLYVTAWDLSSQIRLPGWLQR